MPKSSGAGKGLTKIVGVGPFKLPAWGWLAVGIVGAYVYVQTRKPSPAAPAQSGDPSQDAPRGGRGGGHRRKGGRGAAA